MMGRSHALLAAAAYLALAQHSLGRVAAPRLGMPGSDLDLEPLSLAASCALVVVGGLAPDLDTPRSTLARMGRLPLRLASWLIRLTVGHRGPLHSLVAAAVVWQLGDALGRPVHLAGLGDVLAFGWLVHVLLDAWTRHGVPLFWPLRAQVRLPPGFTTGGRLEGPLLFAGLLACAWWASPIAPSMG